MNLVEAFGAQVAARPDAPAIIETRRGRSRSIRFAELDAASRRAAGWLREAGLQPGDEVLIFQPMSAELYVALLAIFRSGLVAMFVDPSAGRAHLERCCELQPPRALLAGAKAHALRLTSPALRRIPRKFAVGFPVPGASRWERYRQLAPCDGMADCAAETPALLTFTSGSTGVPKGALRTHGFLLAQHRVLETNLRLIPGEVDLTTLPIFLLANLASGVTSVIPDGDLRFPGNVDPAPIVRQIAQHRPTRVAASPAFLERLLDYRLPVNLRGVDEVTATGRPWASFRKIYTGGAPVFPGLLARLGDAAPEAEIVAVYGSTEAEPIAHLERREIMEVDDRGMREGRGLLAGRPVAEIAVRILRDHWGKPVGPFTAAEFEANCRWAGEAGEIVVSGDHVLAGYWRGQGDEETKFRVDGRVWHRTGDAGYLDTRGRLWLLGRCSVRIEDLRGTLYPFSVECAASYHAAVRRSAVVAERGRRVLVLEPREGAECRQLQAELAWAHLDEVRVVPRLPVDRRHNAKIDYPALRKLLDESSA